MLVTNPPQYQGMQRGFVLVRELLSPWNIQKYVLVITAESAAALGSPVEPLFFPEGLTRLSGDTVVIAPADIICFALERKRTLREVSYVSRCNLGCALIG